MYPDEQEYDHLNLQMLRLLDLLYSSRSVTRTAEYLNLSQPTISTWLARLRQVLGDPLFVRTPSGMQPTPHADRIIVECRIALNAIEKLLSERSDFDPATAHRVFRISMTDASHVTLLPRLLARVYAEAPAVQIETRPISAETPNMLISGGTDLVLGILPPLDVGFFQQKLYTQDWICLVRRNNPAVQAELDLDGYRAAEHLGVDSGASKRVLEHALAVAGVDRRVRLELPGFLGVPAIVSQTNLIATLPRYIGEMLGKSWSLMSLACPVPIPEFDIKQYWHERCHQDQAHHWLRGICADLFQKGVEGISGETK
jgi:DNA-binding transcriptional LysR family regulator